MDPVAAIDQIIATLPGQARIIATYRRSLLTEGVPPDETSWLVRDLADNLLFPDRHHPTPEEDGPDD